MDPLVLKGRYPELLLKEQVDPEQLINLEDIPDGIYLFRILDLQGNPVGMEKIVVRK